MSETRYLVPPGADWAVWDDVNGILTFMTDAEAVGLAEANLREFPENAPDEPSVETAEQAWEVINAIWEGDPGGRGWQARLPSGATWLSLRDDEDNPARGGGPEPTFGFGEPPLDDGTWRSRGY
jgi:hypothetical protein